MPSSNPGFDGDTAMQARFTGRAGLTYLILLVVGYVSSQAFYNVFLHPLRHYPGPKLAAASDLYYAWMIITGRPHEHIAALHERYGPVVRITPTQLSFTDPSPGETFLDTANRARRNTPGIQSSMLLSKYVNLLIQRPHENCEGGRRKLEMTSWYNWCTFDIISDLAFGEPFGCLQNSGYHPWVSAIFGAVKQNALMGLIGRYSLLAPLLKLLIPQSVKIKAKQHMDLTYLKVDKRLALTTPRPDFIQSMTMKGDLSMSRREIYDNANLLIGAGSETTSTALSAATYLLTMNPEVLANLVSEVRESFSSEGQIDFVSVQKLNYMLAVLDETLRLHPPSPVANIRQVCDGGDVICDQFVPHGTCIGIWQYAIYRDPNNFTLPDSFIPGRWLGDPRFANDKRDAVQPFFYGPRNCIDKNLAYVEMRVILARVLWNFDLEIAENLKKWQEQEEVYTLWLKGDLDLYLTPERRFVESEGVWSIDVNEAMLSITHIILRKSERR